MKKKIIIASITLLSSVSLSACFYGNPIPPGLRVVNPGREQPTETDSVVGNPGRFQTPVPRVPVTTIPGTRIVINPGAPLDEAPNNGTRRCKGCGQIPIPSDPNATTPESTTTTDPSVIDSGPNITRQHGPVPFDTTTTTAPAP